MHYFSKQSNMGDASPSGTMEEIMELPKVIKRFSTPNKMDQLPKGTVCIVYNAFDEEQETWEQVNEDRESPSWQKKKK